MATVTLADLRLRSRVRADMKNSNFITDTDLDALINTSGAWLYDLLVDAYESNYNLSKTTFTLTSGTNPYTLPTNFYKLAALDKGADGSKSEIRPFQLFNRNRLTGELMYMFQGNSLYFEPLINASETITMWYVPVFTKLTLTSDTLEGVNGWEEFVVVDVARKLKDMQEEDSSSLSAELQVMFDRIQGIKHSRDQGFSHRVLDTRRVFSSVSREEDYLL